MIIGAKVHGQYKGITFSGSIGFMDKEHYGVILNPPKMIFGEVKEKILVPVTPSNQPGKATWIQAD